MRNSRRQFVGGLSTMTAAIASGQIQDPSGSRQPGKADRPLRFLVLGGTGFIGPHQVRYALARGHKLTLFNRGRTNPGLFPAVEQLEGDRNGKLEALKGREWDVVIDNPATLPRWVRDTAQLLKDHARQYVFISTVSVYADTSKPGMDETGAVAVTNDPDPAKVTGGNYGALKALAEEEAEKAFPGRATIIRPGLIVGPGDTSDRFTYWPVRIDAGGEVLAPGDPADPVQFIDARDLGEWCIRMVEQGDPGVYNALGPRAPLSIAEMLYGIRAITTADVRFTWVDEAFLTAHNVSAWSDMPVWVPGHGESAGFSRLSNHRSVARGLTFRPLADTAAATLADYHERANAKSGSKLLAGLTRERETDVLAAWHAAKK